MSLDDFQDAVAILQRTNVPFIIAIKRFEDPKIEGAIWRIEGEVDNPEEWLQAQAAIQGYIEDHLAD